MSILALAAVVAFAPVTAAFAQDSGARRNNGQQQIGAQRHATPGRLIIPVAGTLGTETPPVEPPPVEPPAPPPTPTTPTPTTPLPTTPTPAAPTANGEPDVTGTFSIQRFARTVEDGVAAVGTLTLSFTDPTSNTLRTVVTQVALPFAAASSETPVPTTPNPAGQPSPASTSRPAAAAATQGCGTVSLVLGSRTLDVLEQSIQLDEAHIDLTAVEGTSERLGSLLCQVSDLMNANASGSGRSADLVQTLNTLLDTVG